MGVEGVRTERLRLLQPAPTDSVGVFAILGDPRTVEHNPSERLADAADADELVARWIHHWERHGFGYRCVRELGSNRLIGYVGLKRMTVHELPVLNLVYRFVPDVWGRGFATEAAAVTVASALTEMPAETVVARVRPGNRASRRVALKAGLHRDPALDVDGEDGPDRVFSSREVPPRDVRPERR